CLAIFIKLSVFRKLGDNIASTTDRPIKPNNAPNLCTISLKLILIFLSSIASVPSIFISSFFSSLVIFLLYSLLFYFFFLYFLFFFFILIVLCSVNIYFFFSLFHSYLPPVAAFIIIS